MSAIEKFSPVDGQHLGDFPIASKAQVEEAVARARKAFTTWSARSLKERLEAVGSIKDVVAEHGERYAAEISKDTGKPLLDSLMTELLTIPFFIDYYQKEAPKVLGRRKVKTPILFPGKSSYVESFPMGVIAVISPWNFPFQLSMIPVISALIGGNTVVLKPSEVTPLTAEILHEVFERSSLPRDAVVVIQGDGSTGAALTSADVDKIFFTGSRDTGKKVMKAAAEKPIPVELELGGKDPFIVCRDAPLERAARAAVWGGFLNCGQMCISVERLFVVEDVYDEFVSLVLQEAKKVRVGGPEEEADMGPLTFKHQLKVVTSHLADAVKKGATIAMGGQELEREGTFFEPTVITGITEDMEIYTEETFGPVLPIIKVKTEEEALRMANDHQYGLTASVWTKDVRRGLELASRLECGQVMVNDVVLSVGNPVLPFGGVKSSGMGRYHGPEGLLSFVHQKAIMVDRGWLKSEPFWFPYAGKYEEVVKTFHALVRGNVPRAFLSTLKLRR